MSNLQFKSPIELWKRISWTDAAKTYLRDCMNRNCPQAADVGVIEVCYDCHRNPEREIVLCTSCGDECPVWLSEEKLCRLCDLEVSELLPESIVNTCTVCGGNEHWKKNMKGICTGCQRYETL